MTAAASHGDVLIVGAGSAGSVVASCLSTDPSCSVTVVEAGAAIVDPGLRAEVANGVRLPIGSASPLVQRYETRLTARPARAMAIVRGATVGGSGAVNGGYFCRGLPRDFDRLGLAGWAWPDVAGHFRAIETDLDFAGPAHGDAGPILVQRVGEMVGATAAFVDNAREFGMSWAPDLNDVTDVGDGGLPSAIGPVPLNIVDGSRIGPGAAFLAPALTRANLTLLAGHRVLRLRFSGSRVVGVEALGPGGPVVLQAERVVLCAGAIESAHLLMLSGFGSEKMLHALGIDVRIPLQVGTATSDHPEWVLPAPWAVTPGRPVLEVVLSTPDDIEIRPYTGGFVAMVGDGSAGHPDWPHVGVALMRPRSRGRIVLTSADPMTPPAIEHRYDSEPADLAALQAGCELARDIVSPAIQLGEPAWSTSQHLCGSAPMGPGHDPSTVVDEQCRVHGVEGLWVIDGSVLPTVPSRGPHATIVMLGHRAAEFVT